VRGAQLWSAVPDWIVRKSNFIERHDAQIGRESLSQASLLSTEKNSQRTTVSRPADHRPDYPHFLSEKQLISQRATPTFQLARSKLQRKYQAKTAH